ncbi:MAG: hypothetical protein WBN07_13280 [Woeseiaceae bacterium]
MAAVLTLLAACSSSASDVTKTVEISGDKLAEIEAKPYSAGNGPGGFAAAALSNPGDGSSPGMIRFTGFGPYLHEMGFAKNMAITEIDGIGVAEIFADRWRVLRLNDPSAYDAAHYKDLIEYIFTRESVNQVVLGIDVNVSATSISEGQYEPSTEVWQINIRR